MYDVFIFYTVMLEEVCQSVSLTNDTIFISTWEYFMFLADEPKRTVYKPPLDICSGNWDTLLATFSIYWGSLSGARYLKAPVAASNPG